MIEVSPVQLPETAADLLAQVVRSGRLAQGPMVERFESELRELVDVRHVVAVNSGTAALAATLEALGVGPGDEVVTSPLTFVATVNTIIRAGATAVFADIDPHDFTVDARTVEAAVTPRTAALLPVHLYGHPAPMEQLSALADRSGLAMVEDAAQALGASVGGRPAGSFGAGCFSFYATKALTTGEGGMVATNDEELATRVRLLRDQGARRRYVHELVGNNLRMTELQAAVGLSQLPAFNEATERRGANAAWLTTALTGIPGLSPPTVRSSCSHSYQHYTVRVEGDARLSRDELQQQLAVRGVESTVHYPRAVYAQDCYAEHPLVSRQPQPEAERASAEVLSLPVHPGLSAADLEQIADAVRGLLDG